MTGNARGPVYFVDCIYSTAIIIKQNINLFFTFVPCILILSKFDLFTN